MILLNRDGRELFNESMYCGDRQRNVLGHLSATIQNPDLDVEAHGPSPQEDECNASFRLSSVRTFNHGSLLDD